MICKKCGHNITKHDIICIPDFNFGFDEDFEEWIKFNSYCPCGEKLT
jgi:hypothetical protein